MLLFEIWFSSFPCPNFMHDCLIATLNLTWRTLFPYLCACLYFLQLQRKAPQLASYQAELVRGWCCETHGWSHRALSVSFDIRGVLQSEENWAELNLGTPRLQKLAFAFLLYSDVPLESLINVFRQQRDDINVDPARQKLWHPMHDILELSGSCHPMQSARMTEFVGHSWWHRIKTPLLLTLYCLCCHLASKMSSHWVVHFSLDTTAFQTIRCQSSHNPLGSKLLLWPQGDSRV
jgi:hypothetical protein